MRTTATIGIARLLGWMLLAGGLLVTSCSSEEEQKKGGSPNEPGGESGDRREVVLTLKNKLALAPATKAISTAAENAIRTLDVYVFGSDTEDGEYTYQERFAYRAGDKDELPAGAGELQLAAQGADGSEATGLLKLKRGLFVKLYCIANDVSLIDPAGDGVTPVQPSDFVPLTLTAPGETGTKVATPGVPLESSFASYHTHLLTAAAAGDTLACPLAMSGALTTALDLTSFENSARLQAGFKLTRLATRFDIQNVATDSRFTLQSVSMGNGRRGSGYFPIRVYGDLPTAQADELITYPVRTFYGANANKGLSTGVFYSYPSPQADKGYLILKGLYKVNETESKEVSYQIPFRQTTPNGQEMYLDINHNHRYTIAITAADAYHLDANITVADWADDGSIEYTPENTPGEIIVTIPPEFAGETEYKEEIKTMSMSIKAGSTFKMTITTNSIPKISKTYAGGAVGQLQNWLTISEPSITPGGTFSTYTYTASLTTPYSLTRYPRAVLRLTNTIDGSESLLFVEALSVPLSITTPQPPKAPNGSSDNPNSFDANTNTALLYRITGSQAQIMFNCPEGVEVADKPGWLDVAISTQEGSVTTATLTLNNRDAVVADNKGVVSFRNKKKADLKIDVNVALLDAPIEPSYAGIGADNKVVSGSDDTPDNVTIAIKKDNKATVKTTSLDGVSVAITYEAGTPEWLQYEGASSTLATFAVPSLTALTNPVATASVYVGKAPKETNELLFSPIESKLIGAKKATVTLTNIIGGKDYVITMTPGYAEPTLALSGTPVPEQNTLVSDATTSTVKLYRVAGSTLQFKATALGGTKLAGTPVGVTVTPNSGSDECNTENTYTVTWDGVSTTEGSFQIVNSQNAEKVQTVTVQLPDASITAAPASVPAANSGANNIPVTSPVGCTAGAIDWGGGSQWFDATTNPSAGNSNLVITQRNNTGTLMKPATVTLNNNMAGGANTTVTITPILAGPTLSPASGTIGIYLNTVETTTFTASAPGDITDATSSDSNVATVSRSGTTFTVTPVNIGTADITVANSSAPGIRSSYKITVSGKTYNGQRVWKYYGFYIAPEDAGTSTWGASVPLCAKSGAEWYVPSAAEWRLILGGTSENTPASAVVYDVYKNGGVFVSDMIYWSSTLNANTIVYYLNFNNSNAFVNDVFLTNTAQVRCVAKAID